MLCTNMNTKNNFLKTYILVLLIITSLSNVFAQVAFGQPEKINDKWEFYLGSVLNEKTKWNEVNIPHDWSIVGALSPTLSSCTGYLPGGIGWYRKNLDIPADKAGQKLYIYFEGVQNRSEVYINGNLVGKRPNGYVSFMYDITSFVKYGASNEIKVKADRSQNADSRWYSGSGIYRNVWLVYANPLHISQWGVFCYPRQATASSADLFVESEIENGSNQNNNVEVKNILLDATGKLVASASFILKLKATEKLKKSVSLTVKNPKLWSIDNPYLYTLKTEVMKDGKVIDQSSFKTGIRSFEFSPNKGFTLNGKSMKIKGLCIHHDAGALGAAVPREVWERRLINLKDLGCNAIRMSHNIQSSVVYELCDELGLLVMDEMFDEWEYPKRKWLVGWNVGEPGFQGSFDYFNEWGTIDLADGIRRNRNHTSIFAWSIGNEVDYPNDPYSHPVLQGATINQPMFGGYKASQPKAERLGDIAKKLVEVAKKCDPYRPTTAGLAGVLMSNQTEYPFVIDLAGYNYTENRYDTDHATYPNRVIYGSENKHTMAAWKAVRDKEFIAGQFLWTGIDYIGEALTWPSRGKGSGTLDLGGFIKPRGQFRKALWKETPMAYLGTYPVRKEPMPSFDAWPIWDYNEGDMIRVVCYTNGSSVQLYLNNDKIDTQRAYNDTTGIITWDIPYKAGKLSVKAFDKNNNQIADNTIETTGPATTMKLHAYKNEITKDRGVAQIELEMFDTNGNYALLADNLITCEVKGPGKLIGLENGDNTDMASYRDNLQRVFMGKLIAYIEATGEGQIEVKFSSPFLPSSVIVFKAN